MSSSTMTRSLKPRTLSGLLIPLKTRTPVHPSAEIWAIKEVNIVDEHTVDVVLNYPFPNLLYNLSGTLQESIPLMPMRHMATITAKEL